MNSKKMWYWIIGLVVLIAVILIIVKFSGSSASKTANNGSSDQYSLNDKNVSNDKTSAPTSAPNPPLDANGCPDGQNITQTDANGRFKPTLDISNKTVVLDTTMGKITVQLYDKDAPKTVENFVCLVKKGYYNGITFHRVAHGFVLQAGDPTGTGSGGTSVYGPTFEDELYSDTPSYQTGYVKGVLAMANRGPNTNSSQFFIMTADHPDLPHSYTIFGKVTDGMPVVDKIGAVPVTAQLGPDDGTPKTPIVITTATVQ